MPPILMWVLVVVAAAVCGALGYYFGGENRKRTAEAKIGSAEEEAKRKTQHPLLPGAIAEFNQYEFSRAMRLPEGVDAERAKAQFKRGVLTLTIPKKDEVKANRRKLEITAG